ncbi:MAG: ZIP family metal transporter [Bacteroidales bacterium]|nr:ZIP family metal transporter [Bacteroidales bacterium]
MYIAGYSVLFLASLVSGLLVFVFEKRPKVLDFISVFGGAFLMAVCFVHLLPEAFTLSSDSVCSHSHSHEHNHGIFPLGAFVLLGFLLQLILELISKGAEHGHLHNEEQTVNNSAYLSSLMILLGVSIHAFLEGFALVTNGKMNYSLLIGVVLHNIPISMVVMGSFLKAGCSKFVSLVHLAVFAIMGVVGSLVGLHFDFVTHYTPQIMCFVVGILLHVSISTLFDSKESHQYNFVRFVIVLTAFVVACLLPH